MINSSIFPFNNITVLRGKKPQNSLPTENELRNSEFWIYVTIPNCRKYPNEEYPIVQSYVDIFIEGCGQMERLYDLENYSQQCVTTTEGWEHSPTFFVNNTSSISELSELNNTFK